LIREKQFVGKPRRDHCKNLRHRWVDNMKINLSKIGWGGKDWTDLTQ
jgi:hypothetical protein